MEDSLFGSGTLVCKDPCGQIFGSLSGLFLGVR